MPLNKDYNLMTCTEQKSNCLFAKSLSKYRNDEKEVGKKMYKMLQLLPTLWLIQSAAHWETLNKLNAETNLLLTTCNDVYVADSRPKPFHECVKIENFLIVFKVVFHLGEDCFKAQ